LFIWDVSAYREKALRSKPKLPAEQMDALWARFAKRDGLQAYRALRQLAAVPERSLAFLKQKLKPAPDRSQMIAGLLSQLTGAKAGAKLQDRLVEIGDEALPALEKALKGTSSEDTKKSIAAIIARIKENNEPDAKTRQALWAIELLEFMASAEALQFLGELAQGASEAWITREARAAIKRVRSRN
jgi:hypothetical protein